jgi:hypothetical protein
VLRRATKDLMPPPDERKVDISIGQFGE